jgi:hypothetical protein
MLITLPLRLTLVWIDIDALLNKFSAQLGESWMGTQFIILIFLFILYFPHVFLFILYFPHVFSREIN